MWTRVRVLWSFWLVAIVVGPASAAQSWRLTLPDTVYVDSGRAFLRDISTSPVPAGVSALVVIAGMKPNSAVTVSKQKILRQLVFAGASSGVWFDGAEKCTVVFGGREVSSHALEGDIRRAVQKLVPSAPAGAPASWFEIKVPDLRLATTGQWMVRLDRHTPLSAGRNLVRVRVSDGRQEDAFSASVVLHCYGETARAVRDIRRTSTLTAGQFSWEWQDRAELGSGVLTGRESLAGASATRSLSAGDLLRAADLKETPVVFSGDEVELQVIRGQVVVAVRGLARQDGALGQTIPVRNELTGRLVNARITGPGLVQWRR